MSEYDMEEAALYALERHDRLRSKRESKRAVGCLMLVLLVVAMIIVGPVLLDVALDAARRPR